MNGSGGQTARDGSMGGNDVDTLNDEDATPPPQPDGLPPDTRLSDAPIDQTMDRIGPDGGPVGDGPQDTIGETKPQGDAIGDLSTDGNTDLLTDRPDTGSSDSGLIPGTCSQNGAPAPANTVCRPSVGDCDLEEKCSGASLTCPSDSFAPTTTVCRVSTDQNACDPAETCLGNSPSCPTDVKHLVPATPTNLQVQSSDTLAATLTWASGANTTGFSVKRSENSGTSYTPLATPAASPYLDNKVSGGVTYYYVVSAINTLATCESPNSTAAFVSVKETSLIGFWHFDETASPYADSSGNGFNGTGVGSPTSSVGKIGARALTLNGTSQYVTLPASMPPPPARFSQVAWIKPTNPAAGTRQFITGYGTDGGGLRFHISDNALFLQQNSLGATGPLPANSAGVWVHVAGTFDGTIWRVYVNGAQVGTATGALPSMEPDRTWAIGRKASQVSNYFQGDIDEVRIYNRVLTAAEVLSLYQTEHL